MGKKAACFVIFSCTKSAFLKLGMLWVGQVFVVRVCPVHPKMFSGLPGLHPLGTSGAHLALVSTCDNHTYPQTVPESSGDESPSGWESCHWTGSVSMFEAGRTFSVADPPSRTTSRFLLRKTKPDYSTSHSARLTEDVLADDRDDHDYLMQTSTVRGRRCPSVRRALCFVSHVAHFGSLCLASLFLK